MPNENLRLLCHDTLQCGINLPTIISRIFFLFSAFQISILSRSSGQLWVRWQRAEKDYVCSGSCTDVIRFINTVSRCPSLFKFISFNSKIAMDCGEGVVVVVMFWIRLFLLLRIRRPEDKKVRNISDGLSKDRPTSCHLLYYFTIYCSTCFEC